MEFKDRMELKDREFKDRMEFKDRPEFKDRMESKDRIAEIKPDIVGAVDRKLTKEMISNKNLSQGTHDNKEGKRRQRRRGISPLELQELLVDDHLNDTELKRRKKKDNLHNSVDYPQEF